ncbi:MAG: hypothetical protein WCO05_00965 [Candidatus Moraniibacteriota bacterium]|jgi:hypothetical protein
MILVTHALTGAAIGKNIENPFLIIILSLAIHFIMDGLRHGEYFDDRIASIKTTWWKVTLDLFSGFLIILSALYFQKANFEQVRNILLGSFFSMFPDLLTLLFYCKIRLPFLAKIKKFHSLSHRYDRFPKYSKERMWTLRNSINDLAISLLATILLFIK